MFRCTPACLINKCLVPLPIYQKVVFTLPILWARFSSVQLDIQTITVHSGRVSEVVLVPNWEKQSDAPIWNEVKLVME